MENISNMNDLRNPVVEIDDSLDMYSGKTHFPKKLALVNEFLARAGMPEEYYQQHNPPLPKVEELTPLQTELLRCYAFNPSDDQMVKLKIFLEQLFPDKIEALQVA